MYTNTQIAGKNNVDLATAILQKKNSPNTLLVDDCLSDDQSTILLSHNKMEQLGLFSGDTVLLKGKKRKDTLAIVNVNEDISDLKIKMNKAIRNNLR